jgi:hypothetical protein
MSVPAWEGKWSDEMATAVRALGFPDLAQYAQSRPAMTYHQLADELGKAAQRVFAPVQVEHKLRDLASGSGELSLFARTSLVRHLRHLMSAGWSTKDVFSFSHAIGAWGSRLPEKFQRQCLSVAKNIRELSPQEGWLPVGIEDPVVVRAFEDVKFS